MPKFCACAEFSLSLSLSRMWLRRCARLMKSCAGYTRGTKLLYSRLTSSRTFANVADDGRHTRSLWRCARNFFGPILYARETLCAQFFRNVLTNQWLYSIFTQNALQRCNTLSEKSSTYWFLYIKIYSMLKHKKMNFTKCMTIALHYWLNKNWLKSFT